MRLDSHWEIHAVRHSRLTPLPRPNGSYSSSATARTETGWCFLQSVGDPFIRIRLAVMLPCQEAAVSSCLCLPTTHMRLSSHQCEDPHHTLTLTGPSVSSPTHTPDTHTNYQSVTSPV